MNTQCVLLTIITAMTSVQVFASDSPEITMTILNCLQGEAVPSGTCAVSNTKRIEADIIFNRKGNASLPTFAETVINPEPTDSPTQFIIVKATESSTGTSVPVRAAAYGIIAKTGEEVMKITFQILEESNIRKNKIQTFIDQERAEQAAVPGAESQALVDEMIAQNEHIVSAVDGLHIDNRIGNYTLFVEYHSTLGSWTGQVVSPPVVIKVINKGSFFDSLQTP